LGFIDETSKDERTPGRHYGWSKKGKRAEKQQVFVRGRRTSAEALLTLDGIIAATVVEGSMTQELFLDWLENIVVRLQVVNVNLWQLPKCSAYPGPLSVLVVDSAKIHHGAEVLELIDRFGALPLAMIANILQLSLYDFAGVRVEFLPPYSPDLNPIEEAFSKIKHWLRHHQEYYLATTRYGIIFDMYEVMDIITPDDAHRYFIHAGYF
jgi:hypothetical protein